MGDFINNIMKKDKKDIFIKITFGNREKFGVISNKSINFPNCYSIKIISRFGKKYFETWDKKFLKVITKKEFYNFISKCESRDYKG